MAGTVARLVLRSIDGILRFPSGEVWVWELVVHHQPPLHNHHVNHHVNLPVLLLRINCGNIDGSIAGSALRNHG